MSESNPGPLSLDDYADLEEKVVKMAKVAKQMATMTGRDASDLILTLFATSVILLREVRYLRNAVDELDRTTLKQG